VPRIVAFNSSFSNVTPQLSVYVTFDVRLMLRGFICRCVFEKFHDCLQPKGRMVIGCRDTYLIYLLTFILLMWRIGRAPNSIPIYSYIQQDATSHSLFISVNCCTCFGWYCHPSSGAYTTVSTASGICHTVTAICRCTDP
jgi:hypothetical protein